MQCMHRCVFFEHPCCICSAPCAFQRVRSFMQQSQWFSSSSRSSGCCCMAEGSHAEHTCPATCLHHRARAGRDSVGQCLQWSDYAPVLRRVQRSSGCSAATASISSLVEAAGEAAPRRKPQSPAEKCKELKRRRERLSSG